MRKVLVCYVTSNIKEIELPDEMVETFLKPLDNDPDFCLYDECRNRLDEESHGFIGTATTFKAAKQFLLASNWLNAGIPIWVNDKLNEKGDHYFTLKEAYGENWKEVCMDFDMDTLNELGFYLHKEELFEEQEDT